MRAGTCPLCTSPTHTYLFVRHGARVLRCANCGLVRQDPTTASASATVAGPLRHDAAARYLDVLVAHDVPQSGMLAVVAAADPFAAAAEARGFAVAHRIDVTALERDDLPPGRFDSAVVLFQLERAADPIAALEKIHRSLRPGGALLVVTPSLDSWPARVLGSQWPEWLPGTRSYFDAQTIQSALLRAGFAQIEWTPARSRRQRHLPGSGLVVIGRRVEPPPRPLLSVVMPVFNERATFERTLEAVLAKECAGVDKEIVIVESRSTDGTRELVRTYEGRPGVVVIFEDKPRGKGAAVRLGLERASGTIVLIQDADDEYDVNDYDALLEPILSYQRAFVLGSRHVGSWKVRNFANQPAVSAFFNLGHVIFRTAFNVLYGQNIEDPFTMYKVLRRDCLHGLRLECNRFDFDFELVIKLVRKGYIPLEIPVNYTSRSFKDGKKVSALRDPFTWIRALVKYRFASINEP